jgi:hypothetical protein
VSGTNQAGVFTFTTRNLGDEMQSFAALAHLDRVQAFVDRDRLPAFTAPADTACVFNSWFMQGDDFRPPADRIRPVWHGFAAGRPQLTSGAWLEYLRLQPPIGCRDLFTTRLLGDAGLPAYWSGCLTLFLGAALQLPAVERSGVVFVDVPRAAESVIPREIVARAERLSTFPAPSIIDKPLERWATLGRLVRILARAELVVTRRLHVALPAASLGTPVVVFPDGAISQARRRFSGYESILPIVFLDGLESGARRIDWANVPPAAIPRALADAHAAFRDTLASRGLASAPPAPSVLDEIGRREQRLVNVAGSDAPGRISLTLNAQRFELDVALWTDRSVRVVLGGFPGLSKFDFVVEAQDASGAPWVRWGLLRDLVVHEG